MTALQVRDFPPLLLEELRVEAERQHRSVSQQVIYYLEQCLHRRFDDWIEDEDAKAEARRKKRERIFAEAREFPPVDEEKFKELLRQAREELEERADQSLLPTEGEKAECA